MASKFFVDPFQKQLVQKTAILALRILHVILYLFCSFFRPKAVTSLRIALFVGFTIIIAISFILPSFELGTHYHYHNLFKICWLSVHPEDYEEQGFSYFVSNLIVFSLFLFHILKEVWATNLHNTVKPKELILTNKCLTYF